MSLASARPVATPDGIHYELKTVWGAVTLDADEASDLAEALTSRPCDVPGCQKPSALGAGLHWAQTSRTLHICAQHEAELNVLLNPQLDRTRRAQNALHEAMVVLGRDGDERAACAEATWLKTVGLAGVLDDKDGEGT